MKRQIKNEDKFFKRTKYRIRKIIVIQKSSQHDKVEKRQNFLIERSLEEIIVCAYIL